MMIARAKRLAGIGTKEKEKGKDQALQTIQEKNKS